MEQELAALGLGVGARVAEQLHARGNSPATWSELHAALRNELSSKGTLTKTLARLREAGLVVKDGDRYALAHAEPIATVLQAGAQLHEAVAASRAQEARARAARLADPPGGAAT